MSSYRNTFSKQERLRSRKIIQDLFTRSDVISAYRYPLSVRWCFMELPEQVPAQVLFSVPKKRLRKAHDRNRVKRQLKEIYRLHKNSLYQFLLAQRLQCVIVIVYIAQDKLPYRQLENACQYLFEKIRESGQQGH